MAEGCHANACIVETLPSFQVDLAVYLCLTLLVILLDRFNMPQSKPQPLPGGFATVSTLSDTQTASVVGVFVALGAWSLLQVRGWTWGRQEAGQGTVAWRSPFLGPALQCDGSPRPQLGLSDWQIVHASCARPGPNSIPAPTPATFFRASLNPTPWLLPTPFLGCSWPLAPALPYTFCETGRKWAWAGQWPSRGPDSCWGRWWEERCSPGCT